MSWHLAWVQWYDTLVGCKVIIKRLYFSYYPNIHPSKGSISSDHCISFTKFIFDDFFWNIHGCIIPNGKDKRRESFRVSQSFISLYIYMIMTSKKRTRFWHKTPSLDSVSRWKGIYPHILEPNPWNFHTKAPPYNSKNNTLRKFI
jgi:hypothetical protein